MLFNIPQFIDNEDKIVGPLTAKQLGWMFGAGVTMLVFWSLLDTSAFIISVVPVAVIFGALAFYRPHNQSLITFIISSVGFFFRPKMYVWRRMPEIITIKKQDLKKQKTFTGDAKTVNSGKIEEITKLLNRQ
jgi:hypothetical protein